jgi:anti-sigma factor RsiW
MTLNNPSLLSAYLDGELEPDERLSIESALEGDPELAEQLRQLTAVHDLLATMPRPIPPIDLASAVDAALAAGPRPRRRRHTAGNLGRLGLAASLLLGLGLALAVAVSRLAPAPAPMPLEPARVTAPTIARAPVTEVADLAPREELRLRPTLAQAPRSPVPAPDRAVEEAARRQHDAETIQAMLDSPRLRRVLFVTDVIGGETAPNTNTLGRVEELVQKTPRTEATYGRITVSQGIIIDPQHPNEATVFALVMNDQELEIFQKRLAQSFPQQVEERGADPAVVTQLADIGSIAVLPGTGASAVVIPRDVSPQVAMRTDVSRVSPLETTRVSKDFGLPDLSSASRVGAPGIPAEESPGPVPRDQDKAADAGGGPAIHRQDAARLQKPAPSLGPGPPRRAPSLQEPSAIVLVWVTTR